MEATDSDGDISEPEGFRSWAPVYGRWDLSDEAARYSPPPDDEPAVGLLLGSDDFSAGRLGASVRFPPEQAEPSPQGRIVFGYDSGTEAHYSAGLGGFNALYLLEQYQPGRGFIALRHTGVPENLARDRDYEMALYVGGQSVLLEVDGTEVFEADLPVPLMGSQVGLTARGHAPIAFRDFLAWSRDPEAFVVMQFGEPYDTLYHEVIKPACEQADFSPQRADDVYGPGIVLADIIRGIRDAAVVIAEITPVNANVFYELGYAHASRTPTILLAARGQPLPFDVSGFRCIFYDDSIGGKRRVETELRRHLDAIL